MVTMPIVTLTSDIGLQDFVVGAIKGQLLSVNASFNIVDISHFLSHANYFQAAYICSNAIKFYPANSFHLVLINVFENSSSHFLFIKHESQFILCPDNGIATLIIGKMPAEVLKIPIDTGSTLLQITHTLARFINAVNVQDYSAFLTTYRFKDIVEKYPLRATTGQDWMEGQILFIDNFENVVVNITFQEFEQQRRGRSFGIGFAKSDVINKLSNNYASVTDGDYLAWFNSAGYLELAINKGNMAGLFGLQNYSEKMQELGNPSQNKWFYQTVRVYFDV
jgi:S-adenosyl-L-methionine hydrolase (adenosine-forming)